MKEALRKRLQWPEAVDDALPSAKKTSEMTGIRSFLMTVNTEHEIFRGTLCRAAAEPRQILRPALHHHAAGVIIWHTHPSGDPTPSVEDRAFTRRLACASELLGVCPVDHLILGNSGD